MLASQDQESSNTNTSLCARTTRPSKFQHKTSLCACTAGSRKFQHKHLTLCSHHRIKKVPTQTPHSVLAPQDQESSNTKPHCVLAPQDQESSNTNTSLCACTTGSRQSKHLTLYLHHRIKVTASTGPSNGGREGGKSEDRQGSGASDVEEIRAQQGQCDGAVSAPTRGTHDLNCAPNLHPEVEDAHMAACAASSRHYTDPVSGYQVRKQVAGRYATQFRVSSRYKNMRNTVTIQW